MKIKYNIIGEEYDDNITFLTIVNTRICNLKCNYCLSNDNIKKFISIKTIDKIHNIFLNNKKDIFVFGGETFLDKEIIKKMQVFEDSKITYQTNGNVNFQNQLKYLKPGDQISFTIHYTTDIKKLCKNIKICKKENCLGDIDFMFNNQNIEIFKILKHSFPHMGFQVPFQNLTPLTLNLIKKYDHYRDVNINNNLSSQFLFLSEHINNSFKNAKCNCGRNHFLIDYNENVFKCEEFYFKNKPYTNLDNFQLDLKKCSSDICRVFNSTRKIIVGEN